ncbi:MAG: extracellular solute-binding protein [Candidatus Kapabacteria bacterium]|nr:extracellular solute-binding protein [Candidatus Kapabacteria bacterium]
MRSMTGLLLSGFFIAAFLFGGCSGNEANEVRNVRTIRFWQFWSDAPQRAALDSLLREFEQANDCTVEVTNLLWNDGKAKLQAAFNSGAPPDVIELGSDWIAQFSSAGVLQELPSDSAGIARFVPYAMAPATWNRRVFAYPWTLDTRVMYANAGVLERIGQRTSASGATTSALTFDDVLAMARSARAQGVAGIGINGADRHRLYKKLLPMFWTYGGDIFDQSGKPVLNSPENIRALTMYADLSRAGTVETQRQLDAAFMQGQLAFWNSGSWLLPKLAGAKSVRYTIMPYPGVTAAQPGISFAGGEYLAVSAKAGNKDLARKLVNFLTNGEQSVRFCSKVAEAGFPADKLFTGHASIVSNPDRAAFATQLRAARMTPVHPRWLDIEEIIEDAAVRVLYGEQTPQQALAAAQQEVEQIVNTP